MSDDWEIVVLPDYDCNGVRRLSVPGGWLYQTGTCLELFRDGESLPASRLVGWGQPVFVPA